MIEHRLTTFRDSLSLLGARRFGTFWFASLLSSIATWAQQVAQPWLLLTFGASRALAAVCLRHSYRHKSLVLGAPRIARTRRHRDDRQQHRGKLASSSHRESTAAGTNRQFIYARDARRHLDWSIADRRCSRPVWHPTRAPAERSRCNPASSRFDTGMVSSAAALAFR
jgi:hypothetical protein